MSKLVQRIVALVVMLAVVMSATAYGASTFVVDYQELKSDAPVRKSTQMSMQAI